MSEKNRFKHIKTVVSLTVFILGLAVLAVKLFPGIFTRGHSFSFKDTPAVEALTKVREKTGQPILFMTNLTSMVTMDVKNAPLGYILDVMADKANFGWHETYVIYKNKFVWKEFQKVVLNEVEPKSFVPSEIIALGWRFRGRLDPNQAWEPVLMNFSSTNQPLNEAAARLSRMSRARVFVDPSLAATKVSLNLQQKEISKTVKALANAAGAEVERALVVRSPRSMTLGFDPKNMETKTGLRESIQGNLMAELQGTMAAMPPAERERLQALIDKYMSTFLSMAMLSKEERQAKMAEMGNDPEVQKVVLSYLLNQIENSAPEERAQLRQRIAQQRKNRKPETNQ